MLIAQTTKTKQQNTNYFASFTLKQNKGKKNNKESKRKENKNEDDKQKRNEYIFLFGLV